MASSFSLKSSSTYGGRYMQLTCSQTKDIARNVSIITWTLSTYGGSSTYYSTGPTKVIINGSTVYSKARVEWEERIFPAKKDSVSGTIEVQHDTYGNKSISVSLSTAIWYGSASVKTDSGTWTLDNIPRASQPSLSKTTFTIGESITIYTNRVSSNFTHAVYIQRSDGLYGNPVISGVGNSWTWDTSNTNLIDLCYQIQTKNSYTANILLRTWNGDTQIGDKVIQFTANIPSYSLTPSSCTISIVNEDTKIAELGVVIKNKTKIYWDAVTPASQYRNYITNYYLCLIPDSNDLSVVNSILDLSNSSTHTGTTNVLSKSGTYRLKMCTKDSRDHWANYVIRDPSDSTKPFHITIYDYTQLTLNTEISTPNTSGQCTVRLSGNYWNDAFGTTQNYLNLSYRYKEKDGTYGSWVDISSGATKSSGSYVCAANVTVGDYTKQYIFQVRAEDRLNTLTSGEISKTCLPVFDWGPNDFMFNVPVELQRPSGNTYYSATRTDNNRSVRYGIGSGGVNAGIWDEQLANWLIKSDGTSVSIYGMADYVVEDYKSNNWRYTKWASGKWEGWYTENIGQIQLTTEMADGVYSNSTYNSKQVNLPMNLNYIRTAFCNVESNTYTMSQIHAASGPNGYVKYRLWSSYSSSPSCWIEIYILGDWK